MGHNQELEDQPLHMGQQLNHGRCGQECLRPITGKERYLAGDSVDSVTIAANAERGMSGGPARAEDYKVAGINHRQGPR